MQGGNLDIISATEALSSWPVEDAVIVLFTGSDQSKFPAAGRGYNKIAQTIQTSTVQPTSEEPTSTTITTTDVYYPPSCGLCILLDASVEGWETYPTQVEYMIQLALPIIQQAVAAPYGFSICVKIFGQGDSVRRCSSDYKWLITRWEELNQNVSMANAGNTTIADQMASLSLWRSCADSDREIALIFTNSDQAEVDAVPPFYGSNTLVRYGHAFSGANLGRIAHPVGLPLTETMLHAADEYCRYQLEPSDSPTFPPDPTPYPTGPTLPTPSAEFCMLIFILDGSIEALDSFGEQITLMTEAAITMFKELQDLRFSLVIAGGVVGQSEFDIDNAFHSYTNVYWYYDYVFAVGRKNVTRLAALNHTIADTLATLRGELYPDLGAAFFFSNSPQAEVDAIPTSDFRRQLYGYSLAGADLSRIAKPFQIPLTEDTIADFRDLFCLGPG
ncbi:unnamed protein product, partial [Mesorhabditis spiculigera]